MIPLMISGVFSVVVRLSCVPAPLFQLLAIWPNESAWFQMPTLSIRPLTVKFSDVARVAGPYQQRIGGWSERRADVACEGEGVAVQEQLECVAALLDRELVPHVIRD